jgi:glycosyltransferase involved in cell wall biosynthesis
VKILHIPYGYFPDPPGGTEIYVASLARELAARGADCVIAAPATEREASSSVVDGIRVHRVPVTAGERSLASLYGEGDESFRNAMLALVAAEAPDVVHLHAYTTAISGTLAQSLRAAGYPIVATYHTPTVTCQRGTLLRFGRVVCDGRMIAGRCAACVVQSHGMPRPIADVVGHLPTLVGRTIQRAGLRGGGWTALQMSELMRIRHEDTRRFLGAAHVIVAPAPWVRALLIANGVDPAKIALSLHGLAVEQAPPLTQRELTPADRPLRMVMLGRVDPTKGIDLLLRAMALEPTLQVELDVYGSVQREDAYVAAVRDRVARDRRVRLLSAVRPEDVVQTVAAYDVMLVPSQVVETGPLVVLDAHAAGVPVIGSSLGGIADRVRDDVDGQLVAHGSVAGWAAALRRVAGDRSILDRWRRSIPALRTMKDVADEMFGIYQKLAGAPSGSPVGR